MSLRPSLRTAGRTLVLRSRPLAPRQALPVWAATRRGYADERKGERSQPPTLRPSENAAFPPSQIGSEPAPGQQSTTDEAAAALEELVIAAKGQSAGLEGGLTEAQEQALYNEGAIPPTPSNGDPLRDLEVLASGGLLTNAQDTEIATSQRPGYKFPLPSLPLPPHSHLKSRYHPVLDQLTNLMMRDGKKAQAQRNMAMVLNFLRTSPPPIINPRYPLLPGAPPPAHLPLNPVLYLTLAIDSVAPLLKIRRIPGGAGGGRPLELPVPLAVRQRRRAAFQWILDVVNKKPSKGSGRTQFPHRVADEVIAVVEGRSGVWDKRLTLHKLGTATRANLTVKPVKAH
ncbi:30S ribosomal protein S7 [Colletotrichum higginsianum]|uniref:Small ribosomal subunit protein uS7m n=2 Tax=Colletotrichum higginsianum TaxID=80884 RepID=H1VMM3_COLHI|nr:30S ribosomal protein S7 [Colletotrichum higginsianum IMI 349063]OBR02843.1 30S ribosomal protein S7 [Colletotrichum higginsianum IMI 349063]TID07378.1 37S ribosomal protein S7, mitochondrial [Colletotrichum higginsianum]CCF41477.1 30S ribosomal protein S7 [Colletotrichum higginsianum]